MFFSIRYHLTLHPIALGGSYDLAVACGHTSISTSPSRAGCTLELNLDYAGVSLSAADVLAIPMQQGAAIGYFPLYPLMLSSLRHCAAGGLGVSLCARSAANVIKVPDI